MLLIRPSQRALLVIRPRHRLLHLFLMKRSRTMATRLQSAWRRMVLRALIWLAQQLAHLFDCLFLKQLGIQTESENLILPVEPASPRDAQQPRRGDEPALDDTKINNKLGIRQGCGRTASGFSCNESSTLLLRTDRGVEDPQGRAELSEDVLQLPRVQVFWGKDHSSPATPGKQEPITLDQLHCQHVKTTRQGSNGHTVQLKCKQRGLLLDRQERGAAPEEPEKPSRPSRSPARRSEKPKDNPSDDTNYQEWRELKQFQ